MISARGRINMNDLLTQAFQNKASDLHILVGKRPLLRIDGVLHEIEDEEMVTAELSRKIITEILSPEQLKTLEEERDIDISYELDGTARFRVNCHYEKNNLGLVARVISYKPPLMEEIMMPDIVYKLTRLKQGLILVTGPTGCGKSTSLAAMINLINSERREHIVTLEDPIEFVYESNKSIIRQRQLGSDMYSFEQALKHVLRQDPNVILVGEMRDLETIATALTIAETGHLVFATLHTLNAAQTIDRIIDVFPPYQQEQVRLQLSMVLRGAIAQQLVPATNGGRIAAREILINTPAVSNLIRENKVPQIKTVIQTSANEEMVTMDQDLKKLYKDGLITRETAQMYMTNPQELK